MSLGSAGEDVLPGSSNHVLGDGRVVSAYGCLPAAPVTDREHLPCLLPAPNVMSDEQVNPQKYCILQVFLL